MDTIQAFLMGQANIGRPVKTFDWDKAARRIREEKPQEAEAGLASDWECTGGLIYSHRSPVPHDETYVYLRSTWATPMLRLDGEDEECWIWHKDAPSEWVGPFTGGYWPKSAVAILESSG